MTSRLLLAAFLAAPGIAAPPESANSISSSPPNAEPLPSLRVSSALEVNYAPTQQEQEKPLDAIDLWNGRDFTGWTFFVEEGSLPTSEIWKAKDGVLRISDKSRGYVRTDAKFSDYHLHVEWRWPAKPATSGVFIHTRPPDALWPHSVQVSLKTNAVGELIGQGGFTFPDGTTIKAPHDPKFPDGTSTARENAPGEWNACDIICRRGDVQVFVNGTLQHFLSNAPQNTVLKLAASSGHIALQFDRAEIEFQKIWIRSFL